MKRVFATFTIILVLSSCRQPDAVELATATIASTVTTAPTATQEIVTVETLYNQYFAGKKIDVSKLSEDEWVELSVKLAEKKNADRGVNVLVYDYGQEKPTFIDPNQDNMMVEYDGVPSLDKTIEMFVPIAGKDEQGNLQFEVDGQMVTIGASAGVDWDMRVSEYGDPRIDWPIEEIKSHGMTNLEYSLQTEEYNKIFIPAVLLEKNLGQLQITGVPTRRSTLSFLIPETDVGGQPLLARKIIVVGGPSFRLYEEGSDLDFRSPPMEMKPGQGWHNILPNLNENWTYYLALIDDQDFIYGNLNPEHLINYQGLISSGDSAAVYLGEKHNDKDMLSLAITQIIKAKVK
ncbi:MAG: hypothetical protein FJZ98_10205 [Chloroflexi bacterium]|nr:hypothetical protein [Chloroflexota bacterium]